MEQCLCPQLSSQPRPTTSASSSPRLQSGPAEAAEWPLAVHGPGGLTGDACGRVWRPALWRRSSRREASWRGRQGPLGPQSCPRPRLSGLFSNRGLAAFSASCLFMASGPGRLLSLGLPSSRRLHGWGWRLHGWGWGDGGSIQADPLSFPKHRASVGPSDLPYLQGLSSAPQPSHPIPIPRVSWAPLRGRLPSDLRLGWLPLHPAAPPRPQHMTRRGFPLGPELGIVLLPHVSWRLGESSGVSFPSWGTSSFPSLGFRNPKSKTERREATARWARSGLGRPWTSSGVNARTQGREGPARALLGGPAHPPPGTRKPRPPSAATPVSGSVWTPPLPFWKH